LYSIGTAEEAVADECSNMNRRERNAELHVRSILTVCFVSMQQGHTV
jgi:hypothetical protein